jgi:DNA-binding CsgD family transcriptional regulator
MKQAVSNPWGLTCSQVDAMDALCEKGTMQAAAARLDISYHTLNDHTKAAYSKLGAHHMIHACLKWDRWRQTDGKGVPA